jgi:hypothetical protein
MLYTCTIKKHVGLDCYHWNNVRCTERLVAQLGHIIVAMSQPVVALRLSGETSQLLILYSQV